MQEKDKLLAQAKREYPKGTIVYDWDKSEYFELTGEYVWQENKNYTINNKKTKTAIQAGVKLKNDAVGIVIWGDAIGWIEKKSDRLSMNNLIEDEYYRLTFNDGDIYIIKSNGGNSSDYSIRDNNRFSYYKNNSYSVNMITKIELATQEEKDWLNICIKADKFIPKEEVLKSKEPKFEVGKWYKGKDDWYSKFHHLEGTKFWGEHIASDFYDKSGYLNYTEEELDLIEEVTPDIKEIQQCLPKEHVDLISKKFILPANWHVVVTEENQDILSKWRFGKINGDLPIGYICGRDCWGGNKNSKGHNPRTQIKGNDYDFGIKITFDQFKKYVLGSDSDIDIKDMSDKELLEYANKHYVVGTTFKSIISDHGKVRECKYYGKKSKDTFGWIIIKTNRKRGVYCNNGMYTRDINGDHVCSNPTIWNEENGWCPIVSNEEKKPEFKVGDWVIVDNYCKTYDLKALQIRYISNDGYCYFTEAEPGRPNFALHHIVRHATQEEINKVNKPKEMNNEELLKEAKKRYPIGTEFIPAHVKKGVNKVLGNWEIESDGNIHVNFQAIKDNWNGCIYYQGEWAEIISNPVEKWNVGTYGVFLENRLQANNYKRGDIQQIRSSNNDKLRFKDGYVNDIGSSKFSVEKDLAWFPTLKEAEEFAKTLVKSKDVIPEYVELISGWSVEGEFIGEIFKLDDLNNLHKFQMAPTKEIFREQINKWIHEGLFKPSTKEAYEAQNKPKELKAYTGKFKVGDTVRIIRKAKDHEGDWENSWIDNEMDTAVGNESIIIADRGRSGYILDCNIYNYPEFVLELVESKIEEPTIKYVNPWDWYTSSPDLEMYVTVKSKKIPELEKVELLKSKVNKLY